MDTVGKFGHFHQGTVGKEASFDLRLYFSEVQWFGSRVKPSKRWENVKSFFFRYLSATMIVSAPGKNDPATRRD